LPPTGRPARARRRIQRNAQFRPRIHQDIAAADGHFVLGELVVRIEDVLGDVLRNDGCLKEAAQ
jgi:hypothetical protein